MNFMKILEINDMESLKRLIPQWGKLYERCLYATPFQSPVWLFYWWKYFGSGKMKTITLWDKNILAGIAPFYIYRSENGSILCLMGTGISDYLDILIDPKYHTCGNELVWKYIGRIQNEWDECDFQELKYGACLLRSKIPSNFFCELSIQDVCSSLVLPESIDSLSKKFTKKFRSNINRCKRKIELRKNVLFSSSKDNFNRNFDELVRLHCARWESRSLSGVINEKNLVNFYREVSLELKNIGMADIYTLQIGENVVAAYFTFTRNDTVYAYLGGFDPDTEKLSPGTITLYYVIHDAILKRKKRFDFLRGDEPYKCKWNPENRYNCQLRVYKK